MARPTMARLTVAVPPCATIQVLEGENTRLREAQVDAESKTARAVQEAADYRDAVRTSYTIVSITDYRDAVCELRSEQRLAWLHLLWPHLVWPRLVWPRLVWLRLLCLYD